jgi:hypothetical protein
MTIRNSKRNKATLPKELLGSLQCEYADIGQNWRFFIQTRFLALGSFLTFHVILFSGLSVAFGKEPPIDPLVIIRAVSGIGIVITIVTSMIDYRSHTLFQVCLQRGIEVEDLLGLAKGQYHLLKESEHLKRQGFLVSHSRANAVLYGLAFVAWLLLLLISLMQSLHNLPILPTQ